jgi:3-oxoacyl-(acyl-carrier-protein) synthase
MSVATVWISGVGAISAAGADVQSTLHCFGDGARHYSKNFPFETSVIQPAFHVDAPLPNPGNQHEGNRTFRLTMHAVHQALAAAGLESIPTGTRVGICMGTTVACQLNSLPFYAAWRRNENPPLDRVYDFLNSNLAQATGKELKVTGPRLTIVNACSSGTDAIGVAASWIRAGLCDLAIAGGADEMYTVPLSGFWSLGVMSTEPCMPFDRDRCGLNLGEGAGIVVLESQAFADRRGKKHQFEVAGYGSAGDAYHLTAPHPQGRGLEAAIKSALGQAKISPDKISFVNAHGTATLDNDRTEAKVLSNVFGPELKFLSTKGYTGHTLGAAGGLEAVFALLGLREGWIPANAGFKNRADDIGISPVTQTTKIDGEYAMSTSLAFGGNNAALIVRRVW